MMTSTFMKEKLTPYPVVRLPAIDKPSERNEIRKNRVLSTRFMDNYFDPKVHSEFFKPNGLYIRKKLYESSDSGLGYYFENPNVIMKPDITKDPKKATHLKAGIVKYPEFNDITSSDRIISIEYCANCKDHSMHTYHSEEAYFSIAKCFSEVIKYRFPAIKVLLKPIDTNIIKNFKESYRLIEKDKNINDKYKPVRIGAFEINMCCGNKKDDVIILHSKLDSNQWPNIDGVLDKITKYVPIINLNINLFESEDKEKDGGNIVKDSNPLKNIQVNIYRMKIQEINKLKKIYSEQLELIAKPKGIKNFMMTMRYMETNTKSNTERIRPFTPNFYQSYDKIKPKNYLSKVYFEEEENKRKNEYNNGKLKSLKSLNQKKNKSDFLATTTDFNNEYIYDNDLIKEFKGLIMKKYESSNDNGKIMNIELPYDSYYIEVLESANFCPTGAFIRTNYFISSNDNNTIQKYIPLKYQKNSYVKILVNAKKMRSDDDFEFDLISEADVYLKRIEEGGDGIMTTSFGNNLDGGIVEKRIKVRESNVEKRNGSYEIVLEPGWYTIEVRKKGYEDYKKTIHLLNGEMNVDVLLKTSKSIKLNVLAYLFSNKEFPEASNTFLKLTYSSGKTMEGVTNNIGKFTFENVKDEESLSVLAQKEGFFPVLRNHVGDEDNKNSSNSRDMVFIMVKKDYVLIENIAVLFSYSNLIGDNLDFHFNYTNKITDSFIEQFDSQKDYGVVSHLIKLRKYLYIYTIDSGYNPEEDTEHFGEIMRITAEIKNSELLNNYDLAQGQRGNGLIKNCHQICIYTSNEVYSISPPEFSAKQEFKFWDIGYFDLKKSIFYETGQFVNEKLRRELFFIEWFTIMQLIVQNKVYDDIFMYFGFQNSILDKNDRYLHEPQLFSKLNELIKNKKSVHLINTDFCDFSNDFFIYTCNLFKTFKGLISFMLIKKKILSNLKNFKDLAFTSTLK